MSPHKPENVLRMTSEGVNEPLTFHQAQQKYRETYREFLQTCEPVTCERCGQESPPVWEVGAQEPSGLCYDCHRQVVGEGPAAA